MKKKTIVLFSLFLSFCIILGACTSSGKLPDGFEEEKVVSAAKKVVTQLSNKEYDAVVEGFSAEMAESLDSTKLAEALGDKLYSLGAFKEFKSTATASGKSDKIGAYAIIIIVCKYENGRATYTISIDADGKTCGLYMK